jgi:hypothetical protein
LHSFKGKASFGEKLLFAGEIFDNLTQSTILTFGQSLLYDAETKYGIFIGI